MPRLAPRFLLLFAAAACAAAGSARAAANLDRLADRHLPWRMQITARSTDMSSLDLGAVRQHMTAVVDGELVYFTVRNPGIVCNWVGTQRRNSVWQHNLPPEYCGRTPCASLDGLGDADGDGDLDLLFSAKADDGSHWLLGALDLDDAERVRSVTVPAGEDLRGDGGWDGIYRLMGTAPVPTPEGPRPAFIVLAQAGFDQAPRGVLAVDTATGDTLWTDLIGAKPVMTSAEFVDLDGDGGLEVVFLTGAVRNLGGRKVGGLSDDVCHALAVRSDGTRMWTRSFPANISGFLALVPGPDGLPDVAVCLSGERDEDAILEILDGADGHSMDRVSGTPQPRGLVTAPDPEGGHVYFGSANAGIVHYRYDGALRLEGTAQCSEQPLVLLAADILPEPGLEVAAAAAGNHVMILDENLRPLAYVEDPLDEALVARIDTTPLRNGHRMITASGSPPHPGLILSLQPNPRPVPWGMLGLLPAVGGAAWYVRRLRRGASPATRRELRLQLLGRLELSNHGAIGALRSLRRLVWILDARRQAAGPDPDERLAAIARECGTHMLPELQGILEMAGMAGCAPSAVGQANSARERIVRQLGDGRVDDLEELELRNAADSLDQALQDLRREVENEFRADLTATLDRVLSAHAEAVAAGGVAVVRSGLDAPLWCRIDAEELVFVLDNLVENALRAMGGSARRELRLSALRDGGDVLLEVADTGCGISPDDWEAVLETRRSARETGGLGLPASRRLLRKYGGGLAIKSSRAGQGATFVMNIAPAPLRKSINEE